METDTEETVYFNITASATVHPYMSLRWRVRLSACPNKEPLSPSGITIIRYRYCKVAANTFGRGRFYVDCSSTRYECECNCNGSWQCPREWTDYMWQGLEESEYCRGGWQKLWFWSIWIWFWLPLIWLWMLLQCFVALSCEINLCHLRKRKLNQNIYYIKIHS